MIKVRLSENPLLFLRCLFKRLYSSNMSTFTRFFATLDFPRARGAGAPEDLLWPAPPPLKFAPEAPGLSSDEMTIDLRRCGATPLLLGDADFGETSGENRAPPLSSGIMRSRSESARDPRLWSPALPLFIRGDGAMPPSSIRSIIDAVPSFC